MSENKNGGQLPTPKNTILVGIREYQYLNKKNQLQKTIQLYMCFLVTMIIAIVTLSMPFRCTCFTILLKSRFIYFLIFVNLI